MLCIVNSGLDAKVCHGDLAFWVSRIFVIVVQPSGHLVTSCFPLHLFSFRGFSLVISFYYDHLKAAVINSF